MSDRQTQEMRKPAIPAAPELPDFAAREPAEGDLEMVGRMHHLRYPNHDPSSDIPVEGARDVGER